MIHNMLRHALLERTICLVLFSPLDSITGVTDFRGRICIYIGFRFTLHLRRIAPNLHRDFADDFPPSGFPCDLRLVTLELARAARIVSATSHAPDDLTL